MSIRTEATLPRRALHVASGLPHFGGRSTLLRLGVAAVVYALAVALPLHALITHPGSRIAQGSSDATSGLRGYWATAEQHRNPLNFTHDALDSAPEGSAEVPANQLANAGVQTAFVWWLKGPLGLIGAWNAFLLLGFLATGLAMFAFLQSLGCTFGASLIGGYVLAFSPYAVERAYAGHLAFIHNWIFVLVAATMLRLQRARSWRLAAAVGAELGLAFYLSAYQGLLAGVMIFVFGLVELARRRGRQAWGRTVGLGAAIYGTTLLTLIPMAVFWVREWSQVATTTAHQSGSFYTFSAKLSAYLLPSPRNPLIPVLRGLHPGNYTEETLFFGYSTIILALAAVVLLVRRDEWLWASGTRVWAAVAFTALVPAAFLMSLPPREQIGPLSVPTPPVLIESFTSTYRAYSRFGLLVGFGLAVLAALALSALGRRPGRGWRLLTPVAALIVFVELFPGNLHAFNTSSLPPWVTWLRSHPKGIVVVYPWVAVDNPLAEENWYQVYDRDPRFVSGNETGRQQAIRFLARDLWRPVTAGVLATEGVRYVVSLSGYRNSAHPPRRAAYTLLAHVGNARIYSVDAPKIKIAPELWANAAVLGDLQGISPDLSYGPGFNAEEPYLATTGRWMIQRGEIVLQARNPTRMVLRGSVFSEAVSRTLELKDASGRVLGRQTIPPSPVRFQFGPFTIPAGTTTLTLVTDPGPQQLSAGDQRQASIFFEPLAAIGVPSYVTVPHPR